MPTHPFDPALFAAALDSLPLGVLIADRDGAVVWQNARFTALSGYTSDELAGQPVASLEPPWVEISLSDALQQVASSGQPSQCDALCRHKSGAILKTTRSVSPLGDGHVLVSWQEFAGPSQETADAGQQIEDRYRLISENAVDVIWLWNLEKGRCVFVSPSVQRLRSFSPEEVMEQSMEETMTPESYRTEVPRLQASVAAVEAGDESYRIQNYEVDFICKDGTTVATETVTKLLSDEHGRVRHILGVTRDNRERKLAQEALRNAEEKYRKIFDGALEGIYRTSVTGRPIEVNTAIAKMLGYESPQELLESIRNVGDQLWLDPADCARFTELMEENGTVRDYECRQRRKDGSIIWVSVNSRRVYSPEGEPLYHDGFLEDITERKRMEDALRQSEEKFYKAFASSPACVSILDLADGGRIVDVNEAFERVTGYRHEESIGHTAGELGLWVEPSEWVDAIRLMLEGGGIRNLEHQSRNKNGELRTSLLSAELIELDGRKCAILADIDITQRKEAEERIGSLATAIEQAGEQFVITDLDGTIRYCNPAFEKATGYHKTEVIGQNPRLLKSGKQDAAFYAAMWATLSSGSVWTGQFTNRKKDGSLFQEDATISPLRDVTGKIKGYVAVKRDVSERIQLENQFRQAQKLESVGRLAGGIAHDFNNLLTIINGYSSLLVEQLGQYDPLWLHADEIRKAGDRAAGLTRQLLAFSRKQVIEARTLDLNVIVKDTERMLQRVIGEDIELVTKLDAGLGKVMADPDQIHQVIMNLVVNARDAMPDGGDLVIETRHADLHEEAATSHPEAVPGRYVQISITDTGSGMDETTMESIFEPFFTTKDPGKGTGLGLSTVYGIVRQNGGWVEVSSQPGCGTTFRIYLPRLDSDESGMVEEVPAAPPLQSSKTVLVVEDQEEVRRLVKAILKQHGYEVLEARNGAEAYVLAKEYPGEIHLLLTDVVMPGMNGKELSERLKGVRPRLKVLFSSGYTADVIAHRGVLGPDIAYLPKPFNADALTRKIQEVLLG